MKILIVEDNPNLAKAIKRVLKQDRFSVTHFSDGLAAERYWLQSHPEIDLVILDWMLPGRDGISICKAIRAAGIATPVLMLTARGELENKITGLTAGADDYLIKPFKFEELLARVHALGRRSRVYKPEQEWLNKNIYFDAAARRVLKNEKEVPLTHKEFEILEFLLQHKNTAVSQQLIFDHCFDFAKEPSSNKIEVHIKNLRNKLFNTDEDSILKTVRGVGYRLDVE